MLAERGDGTYGILHFALGAFHRVGSGATAALAATIGRNYRWSAVLGAGAAVALFQALAGRGSGAHGLSQVPRAPELAAGFVSEQPLEGIGNLGEGIFSTAEIFVSRPDYDTAYAVLSFSPLFSAVDGFSALREQNLLSLHQYVPMSALHESYSFGTSYFLVFIAVQLAAIFLTADIDEASDVVEVLLVTSVFAAVLAFHNVISRYLHTLGDRLVRPRRKTLIEKTKPRRDAGAAGSAAACSAAAAGVAPESISFSPA